jgi:hypothetical protein
MKCRTKAINARIHGNRGEEQASFTKATDAEVHDLTFCLVHPRFSDGLLETGRTSSEHRQRRFCNRANMQESGEITTGSLAGKPGTRRL